MDQGVLALSLNKETIKPMRKQFIVYIPEVRTQNYQYIAVLSIGKNR